MYFKQFGFIVLLHLSIFSILGRAQDDDICAEEILELNRILDETCRTDKLFTINDLFIKGAKNLNSDELRTNIETACQHVNATLECLTNLQPVIPECHGNPLTQILRNEQNLFVLSSRYLCGHNPPRFLDFLKHDGVECYAGNDVTYRCMNDRKKKNNLDYSNELLDENMCTLLQITGQCLHTYENCMNKYVENYLVVLTELAVDAYSCPKNY